MLQVLTGAMANAIDGMNRAFSTLYPGGFSKFVNDILDELANGNLGITAVASDVDSLALGGGHFSFDEGNSAGLSFAYGDGRINWLSTTQDYGAGTIALSASLTNYIEADRDGNIYKNTAAFTPGRVPLYTVLTGASSFVSTNVIPAKYLITSAAAGGIGTTLLAANSVTGAILSTVGATRTVSRSLATINATANFLPIIAPVTGAVSLASLLPDTVVAASDANYWTISITNLGQANAGVQAILAATAANTTKATGGNAMAVNVPFPLALAGTSLAVVKGDVLIVTLTKTGTATTIGNAHVTLDFAFTN